MTVEPMTIHSFAWARHELWLERMGLAVLEPRAHVDTLREHHYTNIWRELDRHTAYLFNDIQKPLMEANHDLVFDTILFRLFNKIETWERTRDGWPPTVRLAMEMLDGTKPFTGAYVRCCPLRTVVEYIYSPQISSDAEKIARLLVAGKVLAARVVIRAIPTIGDFLADQLLMDLDWAGGPFPLAQGAFAPKLGPGAKRGFEATGYQTETLLFDGLRHAIPHDRRPSVDGKPVDYTARTFEHTLCEYGKYVKWLHRGTKQVKMRKYTAIGTPPPIPYSWALPEPS
jgi:hypothetical protein